MASAMVDGWVRADPAGASRIVVSDRGSGRAGRLAELHGVAVAGSNRDLVERADIVVVAVKPIDVERVLREVSGLITPERAVLSVAAGVATTTLETIVDEDVPVFRCHAERRRARVRGHAVLRRGPLRRQDAEARRARVARAARHRRAARGAAVRRRDGARRLGSGVPRPRSSRRSRTRASSRACRAAKARELILSTMVGTAGLLDDVRHVVLRPASHGHLTRGHGGGRPRADGAGRACGAASSTACSRRCGGPPSSDEQLHGRHARHFVRSFVQIYVLLILVWIVLGYFRLPYNHLALAVPRIPRRDDRSRTLRVWRRILPMFGPLDLSPMVGIIALLAARADRDQRARRLPAAAVRTGRKRRNGANGTPCRRVRSRYDTCASRGARSA